jgi:hypothetical protein
VLSLLILPPQPRKPWSFADFSKALASVHTGSSSNDPFPLRESPEGTHGVEVYVLEPRAEEARKLIAEYQKGNQSSAESGE